MRRVVDDMGCRALCALAVTVACVLGGTPARADEPRPLDPSEVPTEASAASPEARDARRAVEGTLATMRAVALRVRDDLRVARRRGQKMQIACVDRALSRADAAARRAAETAEEALSAYDRGDLARARAARTRLDALVALQRVAATDAAACAPPPPREGRTTVTVERSGRRD
jgi:hypothetical protein